MENICTEEFAKGEERRGILMPITVPKNHPRIHLAERI